MVQRHPSLSNTYLRTRAQRRGRASTCGACRPSDRTENPIRTGRRGWLSDRAIAPTAKDTGCRHVVSRLRLRFLASRTDP